MWVGSTVQRVYRVGKELDLVLRSETGSDPDVPGYLGDGDKVKRGNGSTPDPAEPIVPWIGLIAVKPDDDRDTGRDRTGCTEMQLRETVRVDRHEFMPVAVDPPTEGARSPYACERVGC